MQGTVFKSLMKYYEENDGGEQEEIGKKLNEKESGSLIDDMVENFQCMNIAKRETNKRDYIHEQNALLTPHQRSKARLTNHDIPDFLVHFVFKLSQLIWIVHEDLPGAKHGLWRQEQKSRAAKIEKQLKARRELEVLIKEQLNRFHAHYNQAMVLTHLEDVSKLLMPQWAAPQELAMLFWLGDWRPSAILELLHALAPLSFLSDSTAIQPALSQFIHEMHIEEAIIDEEMAEIQATCVLYLPFSPVNSGKSGGSASHGIQSMFEKIARVITKAQKLRFKALELVVKKLLNQTEAAEFLVALSGIQDAIHQFAEHKRSRKGPVTVSAKSQNVVETSKQPKTRIEDRISHFLKTSHSSEHGQGIQHGLSEFEEQQGLRRGPVTTRSVRFQELAETSNQPNIPLQDRTSLGENLCQFFEQYRSEEQVIDAISEFEDQQGLRMEPFGPPLESWDVAETSKQPMMHPKDRISSWEKFSRMVEQETSGQGIQEQL
ncbi:hypothetical protein HRI_002858000 [Hibiscus trionum]|uniref:DOG1 domain-containing protein n=1 Tax=Hibiscus trionum TaxID=183268 RepID=A0A9W7I9K5_HIBTR|nr:hypothetical protein HRI_002858000 [Hibiscus trionum]